MANGDATQSVENARLSSYATDMAQQLNGQYVPFNSR